MEQKLIKTNTFWLTRIVFLRATSFILLVAFAVAFTQNNQLIGDRGLLPLKLHMKALQSHAGESWFEKLSLSPTLLWLAEPWNNVNPWLENISLAGATLSALVLVSGSANLVILFTLWVLYHSLVNVGQRWYSFGWESQMLETTFLAMLGVPLLSLSYLPKKSPMPWVCVWGLRWLIVRIMLGAGLIKIRGDKCWLDLTCMNYHYETQPVPNPLSYYLHQSPEWIHVGETIGNHIVELIVPLFAFLPRMFQMTCGVVQILFQVMLILSGNLSFLNWLTILPSIAFFDDKALSIFFSEETKKKVHDLQNQNVSEGNIRKGTNILMACLIGYLSLPVVINLFSSRQMMNMSFDPLRLVNTYGAFGSVTKTRHEVIIFGTNAENPSLDNTTWAEYEFKCKPGNLKKRPCLISPFHYRLDWLMWFTAFQSYEQNPWLLHLAGKFLVNDEEINSLIEYNPFADKGPPRYIKADLYLYKYSTIGSKAASNGQWYRRTLVRNYFPPVDIKMLKPIFNKIGWRTLG